MRPILVALLAFASLAPAALAAGPAPVPPEEPQPSLEQMLCARYGKGFVLLPGTSTCIRVRARLSVDMKATWGLDDGPSKPAGKPR
jgi:hypothetical protein